ncbi:MAG: arginyltransferase [Beggiatoa sp. IS2]|nr:MAG: arginyltransferase [Beggiatoa sp. IS2]
MNSCTHFNLYATPPHECSYLPERQATTVFMDPRFPKDIFLYETLSEHGFRRSGEHLYRPHCHGCSACIPVRIPVQTFTLRRIQRRIWEKNKDLIVTATTHAFELEHFNLYYRYLESRHKGGGMDNPTPEGYLQFLTSAWSDTVFYEFRLKRQLLAVAVVDYLGSSLSAIYTFFDPAYSSRSLGVYAVLWEIEEARRMQFDWIYLGYWIKECKKMSYKAEYQPLEYYWQGHWYLLKV